jgi:hypothetical protein
MKQAVLFCLLLIYPLAAGLKICEIHADPLANPESTGEFFEICNPGAEPFKDSVQILLDSVQIYKGYLELAPGAYQMVCGSDSEYGSKCLVPQLRKALRNSGGHEIILQGGEIYDQVRSPPARSGVSSERNLQKSSVEWILCNHTYDNGEKVTPGFGNPALDRSVNNVFIGPVQSLRQNNQIQLTLQIKCSTPPCPSTPVQVYSDNDLNGIGELLLGESIAQGEASIVLTIPELNPISAMMIQIEDPTFPNDNQKTLLSLAGPGTILKITEIFPAPADDQSEWIEVKNQSAHPVALNSILVGKRAKTAVLKEPILLKPGALAVLCQNRESCISGLPQSEPPRYELDNWPILKNSGDTLMLFTKSGEVLDSIIYPSIKENRKGQSLTRSDTGWSFNSEGLTASPGFELKTKKQKNNLKIGRRVCSLKKNQHPQISGYLEATHNLELQIFSQGGRSEATYLHSSSGTFSWQPKMDSLVPGVYILWYKFSDGKTGTLAWVVSP